MNEDTQTIVKEILDQDERRRTDPKRPLLLNEKGLTLTRVLKIGRGAYNTEWIEMFGESIPLRLLSIEEEDRIRFETHKELRNEKSIYNMMKDDPAIFERVYLCKAIALATTPNPDSDPSTAFLKEKDIKAMPATSFAAMVWHYERLQKEYNPRIGDISEDEANFLIAELLDDKKKSMYMDGLSFLQMRTILWKLLDIVKDVSANIGIVDSLETLRKQAE